MKLSSGFFVFGPDLSPQFITTDFTEYKRTAFFGRSLEELSLCLGYEAEQLIEKRGLDCPSGPSSFVARANALAIDAVGVDPMYYRGSVALERLARADNEKMYRKMNAKPKFLVPKTFGSIRESEVSRLGAVEEFVSDYRLRYPTGIYIHAILPKLPFADEAFDISICGHLLFIYSKQFRRDFFWDALLELCRETSEELIKPWLFGLRSPRSIYSRVSFRFGRCRRGGRRWGEFAGNANR